MIALKRFLVFVFSTVLIAPAAMAQQDPQFTQNMFNKLSYNPAYAGSNSALCGTVLHRQQYTGFEGNPVTTVFTVEKDFTFLPFYMNSSGIGLTVMQDELGFEKTFSAKLAYSHLLKPKFLPGFLRLGIEGGIINKSIEGSFIARDDPNLDNAIPVAGANDLAINAGFGAYYYSQDMYLGLSSSNLSEPTFVDSKTDDFELNYDLRRHYYLTAGYYYDFNTPTPLQWQPSIFAKSSGTSNQVDLNLIHFQYNNFVWGGLSYRLDDAASILAGLDFTEQIVELDGMKVGVAYDFVTSDLNDHTGGSFEVMLNYCYKFILPPKRQQYKTVKWL